MKRLGVLILGASVLAAGCEESTPTAPSQGTVTTFTVPLSAANEVPVISNADADATGTATVTLTVGRDDAGNITSATAAVQISVAGFPAGTTITKAHIHNGAVGVNAGIFLDVNLASGELTLANGTGSITKSGISVPSDKAAAIIGNPAGHYFNVHTALNPDGAIRGQLSNGVTVGY
jgi:hypothetical protein